MVDDFKDQANYYGSRGEPFFFAIDFELGEYIISEKPDNVLYKVGEYSNYNFRKETGKKIELNPEFINFKHYKKVFKRVIEEIKKGNTYLLNLTFSTKLKGKSINLKYIFENSDAEFKLFVEDRFVCFSPERFIKIDKNIIMTYPMKGTIDASLKNAEDLILHDEKEMSEHLMVVDLLRNDLSMVAKKVRVEDYRYLQKIQAGDKELLQVSSKIVGLLDENWRSNIGTILLKLLPAGSISGTPKKKTVSIIKETEIHKRGFFTGIFGFFDGMDLDSAVAIRYIEKTDKGFVYKSGGGITLLSDVKKEYQEMKDKVYVPLF